MTTNIPAGDPGTPPAPIDWVAFGALQGRMSNCTDSFGSRCLDEAASRVLAGKPYKHTGEKLAKCLCRDCRGSTKLQRTHKLDFVGDDLEKFGQVPAPALATMDLPWAADLLTRFIDTLPASVRTAIAFEVQGAPRALILATTGLAARRYRELREASFARFRANPEVMGALRLLSEAGTTGHEFFKAALIQAGYAPVEAAA